MGLTKCEDMYPVVECGIVLNSKEGQPMFAQFKLYSSMQIYEPLSHHSANQFCRPEALELCRHSQTNCRPLSDPVAATCNLVLE